MRRYAAPGALVLVLVLLSGCRLWVGSLNECQVDSDCAQKGAGLACVNQLCVSPPDAGALNPLCQIIGPDGGDGAITLGSLLPMTTLNGSDSQWGQYWLAALKIVVEEMNPPIRAGIHGKPLRFIQCDTRSDAPTAGQLAQYLISLGVPAILSDGSGETVQEATVTVPANVLLLSGAATSPEITTLNDHSSEADVGLVWRTTPSDVYEAKLLASLLVPGDGGPPPRTAVLYLQDPYGEGLNDAFSPVYTGQSNAFFFPKNSGDVMPTLQLAQDYGPQEVVIFGNPPDMVDILNGATDAGVLQGVNWALVQGAKVPQLFSELLDPSQVVGAIGVAPGHLDPPGEAYEFLAPLYTQEVGSGPDVAADVPNVFDAAMLLALAADWAESQGQLDGAHMALALTHVSDQGGPLVPLDPPNFSLATGTLESGQDINIEGASGHLDFDGNGEAIGPIEIWTVQAGNNGEQFQTLEYVLPTTP